MNSEVLSRFRVYKPRTIVLGLQLRGATEAGRKRMQITQNSQDCYVCGQALPLAVIYCADTVATVIAAATKSSDRRISAATSKTTGQRIGALCFYVLSVFVQEISADAYIAWRTALHLYFRVARECFTMEVTTTAAHSGRYNSTTISAVLTKGRRKYTHHLLHVCSNC